MFLLDTHVFIWWLCDDTRLSDALICEIEYAGAANFISAASIWEIAIKKRLGRIDFPENINQIVKKCGFSSLPIHARHAESAGNLPLYHHDPFDRMLIAQARVERLTLISFDQAMLAYNVSLKGIQ